MPIRTSRYASNWELSTARASAVVEYLVTTTGVAPERLSAAGYGEFHPRVPNDSAEHRASNRRIDIVILDGGGR
ncbi:Motility protein B [compost metagenome]